MPAKALERMDGVEWEINPSVNPEKATISFHLSGKHGQAWLYITPQEAFDMAAQLHHGAEWCLRKEKA